VVEARTSAVLASLQVAMEFRPFEALPGTSRSSLKGIKELADAGIQIVAAGVAQ
jgi:hypothetical protein